MQRGIWFKFITFADRKPQNGTIFPVFRFFWKKCTVKSRSGEIRLSGKETLLIDIFLSNPGQVVSRETIQARVWGSDSQSTYNSIEVYLTLLRRKLRSIGSEAQICAERGLGYYLAE